LVNMSLASAVVNDSCVAKEKFEPCKISTLDLRPRNNRGNDVPIKRPREGKEHIGRPTMVLWGGLHWVRGTKETGELPANLH